MRKARGRYGRCTFALHNVLHLSSPVHNCTDFIVHCACQLHTTRLWPRQSPSFGRPFFSYRLSCHYRYQPFWRHSHSASPTFRPQELNLGKQTVKTFESQNNLRLPCLIQSRSRQFNLLLRLSPTGAPRRSFDLFGERSYARSNVLEHVTLGRICSLCCQNTRLLDEQMLILRI